MWLIIGLLGAVATAAEPETSTAAESTLALKPDTTAVALGLGMQTSGRLSAIARLRWADAVSIDLQVGTSPSWSQSVWDVDIFGDLDNVASTRAGHLAANLRLPVVRSARQDLLWTVGAEGTVGRTLVNGDVQNEFIATRGERRQFRSASLYTGAALDHWLTPGCAVSVGVRAANARVSRIQIQDANTENTENSKSYGLSGRISVGVVGVL